MRCFSNGRVLGLTQLLCRQDGSWRSCCVAPCAGRIRYSCSGPKACTWSPVELCDAGALQEYDGDVIVEDADAATAVAVDQSLKVAPANKDRRRGVVKNRGW